MPLRVPEVGGPIDPDNEAHDLIMSVSGGVSKGKRNRIKIRVPAMAVQAQLEGRFLGGWPPYGYKLIDAGPHPNPAKAAGGKRLHALAIDEPPAEVVGRIFGLFIAGHGIYAIEVLIDVQDITLGHMAKVRWNDVLPAAGRRRSAGSVAGSPEEHIQNEQQVTISWKRGGGQDTPGLTFESA